MPADEIVNWDLRWQQREVNRAAASAASAAAVHGDTMQLCSRIAPIVVVGQRVELIRLI
jgi:hypothetical protein